MPILTVELTGPPLPPAQRAGLARRIADAAGHALESEPNGTWVRLRELGPDDYAENGDAFEGTPSAIVTVLHADLEPVAALELEAAALAAAVAEATSRDRTHVHVIYEPPGRGRVAFGGELLT